MDADFPAIHYNTQQQLQRGFTVALHNRKGL